MYNDYYLNLINENLEEVIDNQQSIINNQTSIIQYQQAQISGDNIIIQNQERYIDKSIIICMIISILLIYQFIIRCLK